MLEIYSDFETLADADQERLKDSDDRRFAARPLRRYLVVRQ